jgi:hypothetical protein
MNCNQQGSFTYVSGSIATSGDVGIGSNCCETLRWSVSTLKRMHMYADKKHFVRGGWRISPKCSVVAVAFSSPLFRFQEMGEAGLYPASFCGLPPVDESTGFGNHQTRSAGYQSLADGFYSLA